MMGGEKKAKGLGDFFSKRTVVVAVREGGRGGKGRTGFLGPPVFMFDGMGRELEVGEVRKEME
jgi:hypothetical protein